MNNIKSFSLSLAVSVGYIVHTYKRTPNSAVAAASRIWAVPARKVTAAWLRGLPFPILCGPLWSFHGPLWSLVVFPGSLFCFRYHPRARFSDLRWLAYAITCQCGLITKGLLFDDESMRIMKFHYSKLQIVNVHWQDKIAYKDIWRETGQKPVVVKNTKKKMELTRTNPNPKLTLILTLFSCFMLFSTTVPWSLN